MTAKTVTVRIEDVPIDGITHVLLAIERADRDWYDAGQHADVTRLVLGLREASDKRWAT